MKPRQPAPQSVTTARPPLRDEQSARVRKYLLAMGIRTACFFGAVFTTGYLRWTLAAMAVFLPFFAVVIANAVAPRYLNASTTGPDQRPGRHIGG
ncbi:MAG: DUF3099 domain-containing protein [Actinomycetia bacterium]|nr:DUF3099 domain-containing protein [Actinomycetes bacterium]